MHQCGVQSPDPLHVQWNGLDKEGRPPLKLSDNGPGTFVQLLQWATFITGNWRRENPDQKIPEIIENSTEGTVDATNSNRMKTDEPLKSEPKRKSSGVTDVNKKGRNAKEGLEGRKFKVATPERCSQGAQWLNNDGEGRPRKNEV
ncbi:hypothetical protein K435DRAFT_813587 [Dendrothele bispora CBS 962.96]|uniref:Uncharacterized protein n=1 Tax=Dendrothele bispora (strain CBS 962.96) TaxID=1314807 RepID=A0A4S8KL61_DENBC|nr:hypothetical protein K435DRAFT_813587 [Dendrothele bispora CBS 962.96]